MSTSDTGGWTNDWGEVLARLVDHVAAGTTDRAPAPVTVPVADYLDGDRWAREVDRLFHRSPVVVALGAHVPAPGDYRADELAGVPTLTVRQDDGGVRVFLNVCRHRGAQLVEPGCGAARRFTCPYHAWSYRGDGALVGIAGRTTFGALDTDARGLTEVPSAERAGLVFAVLDPAADLDIDGWLAGYDAVLGSLGLEDVEVVEERELVGPNWKVAFDGYVDGYHLDILHKETIGKDAIGNVITCDAWGPHQRVAFPRRNIAELGDTPRHEWRPERHLSLVHTVFPHLSIAGNGADALMVSQLSPGPTPDRSRTIQTHVLRRGATDADRAAARRRADFLERVVVDEDYRTGLGIQRGLASGANHEFVFGCNEPGNQRFHQWVAKLLAD
jgi:carnitine monooxygenase subunit